MNEGSYKVNFLKIHADHNKIKDGPIVGFCQKLPEVGEMFIMIKNPSNPNALFGTLNTSPVEKIEQTGKTYRLYTQSKSIYEVTILEYPERTH